MQLVISLLVYNQLELTKQCIESILANTLSKDYLLVISDNASRKDTQEYLSSLKNRKIKYIRNEENLGFIKAHNKVFNQFDSKYFCVLNNDLIIKTPGWDRKFINVLKNNTDIAQVGPIQDFGCLGFTGKGQTRYGRPLEYISGSCFVVKTDIIKKIGGLFEDKYMSFAFCEDADLSLRIQSKSYRIFEVTGINILHLHNQSFKNEKVDIDFKTLERNNNKFLLDRWKKYFETKIFAFLKIMINRQGALGDTFLIEPVIRALKEKYPHSQIFVNTQCPQGIIGNPNVTDYGKDIIDKVKYDLFINLDLAYEKRPQMHIVDAYALEAKVILDEDNKIPIYYNLKECNAPSIPFITVCSEGSWKSRTYPIDKWKAFIKYLSNKYEVVEIGSDPKSYLGIGHNFIGKLQLNKTIEFIKRSSIYFGMDGGLMHFAQSVGTPVFIIFGCTSPKYRIHDWSKATVVNLNRDELNCSGCHHTRPYPRTFTECDKDKIYCLENIGLDRVIKTYEENFE